ncbi:hypothetical protein HY642_06525 [Candidatus Woesearchaeota archaeon]|nr:hypothetical protein [Candidatus Woesearchaeota archaeon]
MDSRTAERINALAARLKQLHLAPSAEEAFERAKEIILGTADSDEKPVKQLFKESGLLKEAEVEETELSEEAKEEQRIRHELSELEQAEHAEIDASGELSKRAEDLEKELHSIQEDAGGIKTKLKRAREAEEEAERENAAARGETLD